MILIRFSELIGLNLGNLFDLVKIVVRTNRKSQIVNLK